MTNQILALREEVIDQQVIPEGAGPSRQCRYACADMRWGRRAS
jgi:hypothetical protein